jgi:hypothetical protein
MYMIYFPALSSSPTLLQVAERFSVDPDLIPSLGELDDTALVAALTSLIPQCDTKALAREISQAQNQCMREWQALMVL